VTTVPPQPFAPPGSGWPGDPATATTPVAQDADDVRRLAATAATLDELDARVSVCRACARLVAWRERVALERRRSFAEEPYWGRPVPGWGAESPRVLVIGLAPAAHGGNRTGRVFTGDRSGDLLYAALHSIGLARQAVSLHADDGQQLYGVRLVAPVRCAPPDNKPTPIERDTCAPWLDAELGFVLPHLRAVVALGAYAWQSAFACLGRAGLPVPRPRPAFGHGVEVPVGKLLVIASFHPSQQNTFTGKLTADMLTAVLARAASYAHQE
jgi:uracil-DNA glycosylase